ncbi:hypothetical protein SAMN03080617_01372 [Algoriphagus alkaliphilus]|uniref:TonB protein C-terminal n=1 Tax=Algoriphagus alkaliphilus TaxID=279824 RepID=A0A1G5WZ58_9BACT|nr:hypothetical protein SAMN03080617_01372 [Algoriphagus alkaliphilus]
MKSLIILSFFSLFLVLSTSCESNSDKLKIYSLEEVDEVAVPSFGLDSFYKYLDVMVINPNITLNDTIKYFVEFTVLENGKLKIGEQYPSISLTFDSMVCQTMKDTEPWIPSQLNGKKVSTSLILPFKFSPKVAID